MMSENTSRHYSLETLGDGIYAAIAKDGGAAIGNAGIVDLGDSTLVVDTFLTPTAAEDLRADALRLTGRLPHWVVNTHYHNDHIWGNQVFLPEAHLISTARTRALIQTAGPQEYDEYRLITDDRLKETLGQQAAAKTEEQRASLGLMVGYFSGLAHDFPRLRLTLPNQVFEHRMAIHGSRRRAEIMEFRGAHTGSDAVVYLPDDGIVFMSDLLFIGVHLYLGDGDPDRWVDVLRSIATGSAGIEVASRFVPGHGTAGTAADLQRVVDYIKQCQHIARAIAAEGRAKEEDILSTPVPEDFSNWTLARFFQSNLRFLVEKYQKAENSQEPAGRTASRF